MYVTSAGVVYGKDHDGAARIDSVALTDGSTTTSMIVDGTTRLYWTDIDSLSTALVDGATSVTFTAYGYASVKASDGANTDFAGVATAIAAGGPGAWHW